MGYLALITNSALIGLCIHQGNLLPNTTPLEIVLIVIALEVSHYTACTAASKLTSYNVISTQVAKVWFTLDSVPK